MKEDFRIQLESEVSRIQENAELHSSPSHSFISGSNQRVIRIHQISLDSQDSNSVMSNSASRTQELNESVDKSQPSSASKKKKNKRKKAKKQYLDTSLNDSQIAVDPVKQSSQDLDKQISVELKQDN